MTVPLSLSPDEQSRIEAALLKAFPNGPKTEIFADRVVSRGEDRIVPVVPTEYPEDRWAFLNGLAGAEIALRDAGLKVQFEPRYGQKMLVVTRYPGFREFAYLTTDGNEANDLAKIVGLDGKMIDLLSFEGYLYDTDRDLTQVVEEARAEHPDVDFSRVDPAAKPAAS